MWQLVIGSSDCAHKLNAISAPEGSPDDIFYSDNVNCCFGPYIKDGGHLAAANLLAPTFLFGRM
jgi:hypothetical protein